MNNSSQTVLFTLCGALAEYVFEQRCKIIRTQYHILDLFTYKGKSKCFLDTQCVLASPTDSEIIEGQSRFNLYSIHAQLLLHLSQTSGITLVSQYKPHCCSAQVCYVHDFQSKKNAVDEKCVTFLDCLHSSNCCCIHAATVRQVGMQQTLTDFVHISLFFFSIVNYSRRLEECILKPLQQHNL